MLVMVYWLSTGIMVVFLGLSAYTYFFSPNAIQGLRDLGFPDFFRLQLAVMKILAALILIYPKAPVMLKEWSYAGVAFFLITALVAHVAHKDSVWISVLLVVLMMVLAISYWNLHKL